MRTLRPAAGSSVTLLLEIAGVPVTHVTRASRVRDASMIVPTADVPLDTPIEIGTAVIVIFVHEGQIYRWPMRIEEVLATSYFLTSTQEPDDGDRREFVRALLPMRVRICALDGDELATFDGKGDVSAAGLRLTQAMPVQVGHVVALAIEADGAAAIRCQAHVVRADEDATALEFVELSTADENRLIDLVFQARAHSLQERLGFKLR